jgi:hypothetical protein
MARYQTVVKVSEFVYDEAGNMLDKEGAIIDPTRRSNEVQEQAYEDVMYYLLHWGLTYEILSDGNQRYPIAYTVAICQHMKNGTVKSFTPQDITVVGKEKQV